MPDDTNQHVDSRTGPSRTTRVPRLQYLHDYLRGTAARLGDKEAVICGSDRRTFGQIDAQSDHLAAGLSRIGCARQDRVAIFLDNSPETVVSLYAVSKAFGVFVIVNPTLKAAKLATILGDSQAAILIAHVSRARIVQEAFEILKTSRPVIWVSPGGDTVPPIAASCPAFSWNSATAPTNGSPVAAHPEADEHDLAALIYTSGSTGSPKGVMQPHDKMIAVARCIIDYLENTEDDVILNVLSLAFGYGMYQVLMTVMFGGTVVLERSFVYLHKVLERIAQERVTGFPFVPTNIAMILRLEGLDKYDFSSLRYVTNAGAALPVPHLRQLRQLWPHVRFYSMYGMTECVRTTYLDPALIDDRPDCVGKAIPLCRIDIVDEQGVSVAPGQTGELIVQGENVMDGYWRDPDLTDRVFRQDREEGGNWLHSGDLFRRDEQGFLYFVGRKDDMIKTRGERVSPAEVEAFLLALDGVVEAAAAGLPDEIFGQAIRAFVVLSRPGLLTENDVLKYCAGCMENYMVPRQVVILDELPRTPNGKLDRKQLVREKEVMT